MQKVQLRLRKVLARGYSPRIIEGRLGDVVAITRRAIDEWPTGQAISAHSAFQQLAMERIGLVLTGYSSQEYADDLILFLETILMTRVRRQWPRQIDHWPPVRRARKRVMELYAELLASHRPEDGGSRDADFIDALMEVWREDPQFLPEIDLPMALSSIGVLYSWDAPQSIELLTFGLAMAGLFVVIESRSGAPIMPLGIYRNRAVAVAMIVTLLTAASLHGFVLFLPLYFQAALGASVSQAGSLLAPMLLGIVVGAILAGQMLSRTGEHYRLQALVSTALMGGGMYLFSTLGDGGGFARNSPVLYSQIYLMITALGFGGVVATLSVKDDPRALVDPATARALQESLAETGIGDVAVADRLLSSLNLALTNALSDVFTLLWVAVALCLRVHNEQGTLWSPLKRC